MGMIINISSRTKEYSFYNVPEKVGKSIIIILQECANDNSNIFSVKVEDEE